MAEFRKLFYAFGLASLLVGAASTASAQSIQCAGSVANPPIIREESFTELVGDYVLECTGGVPTASGVTVGQVNITVTVSAPVTSRLLDTSTDTASGFFNEALLIIDEPNSSSYDHNSRPLLACGDSSDSGSQAGVDTAPYTTAGVCNIISTGNPLATYDGTQNHPNVFQGRITPNNVNSVYWGGVPFDPPGNAPVFDDNIGEEVIPVRILRFTNIRVASPSASIGFPLTTVFLEININGVAVAITNRQASVASVLKGIDPQSGVVERKDFLQCKSTDEQDNGLAPVRFREGFLSSFKARHWGEIETNGDYVAPNWVYDEPAGYHPTGLRQNYPGGLYFTESGFTSPGGTFVNPGENGNVPPGVATGEAVTGGFALSNSTGISNAGVATNGTRIILTFKDIPAGSSIYAPGTAPLVKAGTNDVTGVAVRVSGAGTRGDGAFSAAGGGTVSGNRVVYEVLFSRSQLLEDVVIELEVQYVPNLPSDQPEVNKSALVTGGFAPFALASDNFAIAAPASATVSGGNLPIPRFVTQSGDQKLYSIIKCSCNLLFPFVTNAATSNGNFDTGIAIANTSKLPNAPGFVTGTDQQGAVQFWYFPSLSTSPAVNSQCTNTTNLGQCPGTKLVKAGETLTYILSQNNTTWGLDNRAKGFTGYVVAQTGFQYCHAFAYISPEGAFPLTNGMSVGYLGLILDKDLDFFDYYYGEGDYYGFGGSLPRRTTQLGESLDN